jgi:transglutaminase-like putative cysteine protease
MKAKKALGLYLVILSIFSLFPISMIGQAAYIDSIPKLQIINQPQQEYKETDTVSFTVNCPNYSGEVQYRVRLNSRTTKETWELINASKDGYNMDYKPNGNSEFTIRYRLKGMKTGSYNITVFVKRAGSIAAYDNFIDTPSFNVKNENDTKNAGSNQREDEILRVFKGFFQNTDYKMNLSEFLKSGKQTSSEKVKEITRQFNDKKDTTTLEEIYTWIKINLGDYTGNDMDKYSRKVDDIIESGFLSGSNDYALVFSALSRAKGIPAVIVNSVEIEWVRDLQQSSLQRNKIGNHSFVEVFINKEWVLVNPEIGIVYLDYDNQNFALPGNYYTFSKSIDIWETGIKYESHLNSVTRYLFRDFDFKNYENVVYADTIYLGQNIDPRKIKRYELYIVPVCGDRDSFKNVYDEISVPSALYNRINLILPVISAKNAYDNIKQGVPYNAVILTYVSGSYASGNKDYIPDDLAEYLGVDRKV